MTSKPDRPDLNVEIAVARSFSTAGDNKNLAGLTFLKLS